MSDAAASPTPGATRFRALYEAHFADVWHLVRRLGVAERDLEDVVHEVFVVVHRRIAEIDPARAPRAFIKGIAFRVAVAERRRARHRHERVGATREAEDTAQGPEGALQASRDRALVHAALQALPDAQRVVFVLHEIDEHSMPEVAEIVGASVNTCYSRLRLARKRFAGEVQRLRGSQQEVCA